MKRNLALFDFDGTISRKDSMIEFLKFYCGSSKVYVAYLLHLHWLLLMQIGFIEKGKVKEKIWHYLLNSKAISSFQNKARFFSLNILPAFLYNEALQRIQYHRDLGDRIIVVSASAEEWLKPWCDINKLELIATKLEKKDGKLTGKMMTPNCKGPEKVKRVKEFLKIEDYSYISAYGDSAGDKEMLQLAHYPFYRKFRK